MVDLVLGSLVVFFFLVKRAPLKIRTIWDPFFDLQEVEARDKNAPKMSFLRISWIILINTARSLFILLQDFDILYYSLYILTGIVGLTIHPFFFGFHLMDFFKLEQLKTVL